MNLTYRGIAYLLTVSPVFSVDDTDTLPSSSMTIGKYRGASFHIPQPQLLPKSQPSLKLQYRGAPYQPVRRRCIYPTLEMLN